jgi:hypothetical protein
LIGKAYGQQFTTTDTLCFPVPVIKKVLVAAEQKRVLEEQLLVINKRIAEKDSIISLMKFKDETNSQLIKTYEDEIKVMRDQRAIFEAAIKNHEKAIRKLKRKVFWTSAAGVAGMGVLAFLLLTK